MAAIGFAGASIAEEANTTDAATPKAMTDAEMDNVTAGDNVQNWNRIVSQSKVNDNAVANGFRRNDGHGATTISP